MLPLEADAYDAVHYDSHPLPQAHPRRLETLATLFGMQPAPIGGCRVLEIGGGDGGHLVPCALGLPGSRFVGIDRSEQATARGQATIRRLGLQNMTLLCGDLMETPIEGGPFDYIIAHGLYSWVPPHVRERLLEICRENLAPHGVAYISYNVYPGCYMRRMLWDMMRFHVRDLTEPEQQVRQAIGLLEFLALGNPRDDEAAQFYQHELESALHRNSTGGLYHDDLSSMNEPVYFHEFAAQSARYDLQYLAEADFFEMQDFHYKPPVREKLRELGATSLILKEQYLDFIKCRRFRQTLLCRRDVPLNREISPELASRHSFLSPARPTSPQPSLAPGAVEEFEGPRGSKMRLDHPLGKAAILCLVDAWPNGISYADLLARARQRVAAESDAGAGPLGAPSDRDEQILREILLSTYRADLLRWERHHAEWSSVLSERPATNALARQQLEQGSETLYTLNHGIMLVDRPFDRQVLMHADGTRTVGEIVRCLQLLVTSGKLPAPTMPPDGSGGGGEPLAVITAVERILESAAKYGVLAV